MSISYWTTHRPEDTKLSQVCAATNLVQGHAHHWLFGHGNTFPLWSCALGRGSTVVNQVNSAPIAKFIENAATFESADEARRWLRVALNADSSRFIHFALLECDFPEQGFDSASDYDRWAQLNKPKLTKCVNELVEITKPGR